jgi:predicted  nucleic acid-binding Zn-ribbon protein
LSRYFVKHLEVHRSAGAFDFVTQQTDQVRARLNQTEDALKSLRDKTGIVSLKDGLEALAKEAEEARKQFNDAEANLAEQQALVKQTSENKPKKWRAKASASRCSAEDEATFGVSSANSRVGAQTRNGRNELQVFCGITRKGTCGRGLGSL